METLTFFLSSQSQTDIAVDTKEKRNWQRRWIEKRRLWISHLFTSGWLGFRVWIWTEKCLKLTPFLTPILKTRVLQKYDQKIWVNLSKLDPLLFFTMIGTHHWLLSSSSICSRENLEEIFENPDVNNGGWTNCGYSTF